MFRIWYLRSLLYLLSRVHWTVANNWRKSYSQRADFPIQTSHGTSMGYPILLLRIFDFIAATQITIINILHSLASSSSEDWSRSWSSFFTFPNCIRERNRADFFKLLNIFYSFFFHMFFDSWQNQRICTYYDLFPFKYFLRENREIAEIL